MDNNKYYVFATNWCGMRLEEVNDFIPDGEYNTEDEALKRVNFLYTEILDSDDAVYIYHNGNLKEY